MLYVDLWFGCVACVDEISYFYTFLFLIYQQVDLVLREIG